MAVGMVQALVGRVSFTGDLGYEIWRRADDQRALYAALVGAGEPLGLRRVGGRARNTLRLEKGFGTWAREYRPIYGLEEAGLERFVDWRKTDFVGRDAADTARRNGASPLRLVSFASRRSIRTAPACGPDRCREHRRADDSGFVMVSLPLTGRDAFDPTRLRGRYETLCCLDRPDLDLRVDRRMCRPSPVPARFPPRSVWSSLLPELRA